MRGDELPLLHGLPLGVKDLLDTAGLLTTCGNVGLRGHVPLADHGLVARLRAAGAIVACKTNTPDMGTGANTRNAVWGATGNPFDPRLNAGGSSGGSAVALATGHAAAVHRVRHRRFAAHPRGLVRGGRPAHQPRAGGQPQPLTRLVAAVGAGADGAHRGRCGLDAGRLGRAGSAGCLVGPGRRGRHLATAVHRLIAPARGLQRTTGAAAPAAWRTARSRPGSRAGAGRAGPMRSKTCTSCVASARRLSSAPLCAIDCIGASELFNSWLSTRSTRFQAATSWRASSGSAAAAAAGAAADLAG